MPGYRIKRNFGIVRGIVVRSRSIVGTIGASLQTIVGGNISLFSNLCEQTRNDAFDLMLQHAEALGANAVIGVRYDATEIMQGVTEVLSYGTAVLVEPHAPMKIPFTKAHGAKNDFLFTWRQDAPDPAAADHAALARAICDRHTGIGADGWMLVDPPVRRRTPKAPSSSTTPMAASPRCPATAPAVPPRSSFATATPPESCACAPAPVSKPSACSNAERFDFDFEMNMGRAGTHRRQLPTGSLHWSARRHSALGGQPAMRRPRRRTSISTGVRWARRSNVTRIFPIAPTSRSSSRWTITPSTCAFGSAGQGRR